jgi:hypothetical protein
MQKDQDTVVSEPSSQSEDAMTDDLSPIRNIEEMKSCTSDHKDLCGSKKLTQPLFEEL